ncbi:MAG: 4-alpha-glucanotransferase [Eubacteriales bacterium]
MERGSGILLHISSLPGEYGIGTLGKETYKFVDFLKKSGQKYWQILPIGPTGYGNSPYSSFSTFAGNHYFIDFDIFIDKKIITKEYLLQFDFGSNSKKVEYDRLFNTKERILRTIFNKVSSYYKEELFDFRKKKEYWIEDYALFMALKKENNYKPWNEWEEGIKQREPKAINYYKDKLSDEIEFWIFTQYLFFKQWGELKTYTNNLGIKIIGDIPIYVASDSADAWVFSDIFYLDKNKEPIMVSGCPPDDFSEAGQLWGNPVYQWDKLKVKDYDWWIERFRANFKLYDVIRIDHFKGFESFWGIPYGDSTAANGEWKKGPGTDFFDTLFKELGNVEIIAEDLGYVTEEVIKLRDNYGLPGMKVLMFAFNSKSSEDMYLPHNYKANFVSYTGTHDNETLVGWLESADQEIIKYAKTYLGIKNDEDLHWEFIRAIWSSVTTLAIAPMQDFLGLDNSARMNTPNTLYGNWEWRITQKEFTKDVEDKIKIMTRLYGR